MIGKACVSSFQYYDSAQKKMKFKRRPFLIIGQADSDDYIALPISRISYSQNISSRYDYPLEIIDYPKMNLKSKSYVRTHKQAVIHRSAISTIITDFRTEYEEAFIDILIKVEEFQKSIIDNAL